MFSHSTTKISNQHVNQIVTSILNKRQRNSIEQQKSFIRRNTDESQKRNNYLVDKFTTKQRTVSCKENVKPSTAKLSSPRKKVSINDDDDDFISVRKTPKVISEPKIKSTLKKTNPIKECIESILNEIENNDVTCPICNQTLSSLNTIDQRQQHVNQCIEKSHTTKIEAKQQHQQILVYSKSSSTVRKATTSTLSNLKCQICGASFHVKHSYLAHLKKCSNQNSVQLKHVVNFAANTMATNINDSKSTGTMKKPVETSIKSRIIKMEMPKTEDDEQQQLAIALSCSMKTDLEPVNAFDILQAASKKPKTTASITDLFMRPLWSASNDDKLKHYSTRLSSLCERLISIPTIADPYKFPPSSLQAISQEAFGNVNWWHLTTTDPENDEIPMTQLIRILDDNDGS